MFQEKIKNILYFEREKNFLIIFNNYNNLVILINNNFPQKRINIIIESKIFPFYEYI